MEMDALVLNHCCFRFNLRIGTFIIAYLLLILDVIMCTIIATMTVFIEVTKAALDQSNHRSVPYIEPTEQVMMGLLLILFPFQLALLVGLHRHQRFYVKIYLMASFTFIVLDAAMFVTSFVYSYNEMVAVARAVIILVEIYLFIIVRSYYYKMR